MIEGLTGEIKFGTEGFRTNFVLDILELDSHGITKVGTWSSEVGVSTAREPKVEVANIGDGSLKNKTFIVLTSLVGADLYCKPTAYNLSNK